MAQEPVTRYFNMKKEEGRMDLLENVMPKKQKVSSTVKENRRDMQFKAFHDDKMKKDINATNERWLRAMLSGDQAEVFRIERGFDTQLKSLVSMGVLPEVEYKTLTPWNENTNTRGGYNAPPAYVGDLARNLAEYAICRKHFRIQGMKSWKENIPYLNVKPVVAAVAENAAIADSTPTEGNLLLTAYKAGIIMSATNEEIEDANFPLWAAFQDTAWEQFGILEDQNGLQDLSGSFGPGLLYYGDGSLASNGAITGNGAVGVWRGGASNSGKTGFPQIGDAAAAKDAWGDLIYMLSVLPSGYYKGGKFFIDQQVSTAMFSMRDSQNRFIGDIVNGLTYETGLDGQPSVYFRGYEMVIVPSGIMLNANTTAYTASAVPSTPFTIFCNPQKAWATMGIRGGFRAEMLREGTINSTSLATNDIQALRLVERFAFGCAQPNTVVVLRTSAT